jgi:hypothetical protein
MAIEIPPVQPGQLIRAELMTDIIDALTGLDVRLTAVENSGGSTPGSGVRVATFTPAAPHIGDPMTIHGANFDFSTGAAGVTFGPTSVTTFGSGSTDEQLMFEVPAVPSVTPAGRQVVMRVSNFDTHVDRTVTVFPRFELHEDVDVAYVSTTPATPVQNQPAFVHLTLTSRGSFDATLTITASVSTGWPNLQVLSSLSPPQPLAADQILLPTLATRDIFIRIPIPNGTQNTPFTLTVDAQGQGASGSLLKEFTVGQAAPVEDEHIKLDVQGVEGGALAGSTISVPGGGTAELTMTGEFDLATSYTVTASLVGGASGWSLTPPTTTAITVTAAQITAGGGWATKPISVVVNAGTSGTPPQLKVAALRQGQTVGRERTFQLARS